jgi:hypothetical protein
MEKFVAQRNISHFELLLRRESDPNERRILESMLREERVRLAAAEAQRNGAFRPRFAQGPIL